MCTVLLLKSYYVHCICILQIRHEYLLLKEKKDISEELDNMEKLVEATKVIMSIIPEASIY